MPKTGFGNAVCREVGAFFAKTNKKNKKTFSFEKVF